MDTQTISMYEACLLHSRADRNLRSLVADQLEPFDVTMMEWLVLGVVRACTGIGMSMSAIAKELSITLPQLTPLVQELIKKAYITQQFDLNDQRTRYVSTTKKGLQVLEQIEQATEQAMRTWASSLPREDIRTYIRTVRFLAKG
ncbi:hypothetical protein BH23PAT2_BH23PAT2_06300 [soil metagenome]